MDKEGHIEKIATELGLKPINSIKDKVNIQFQSKGKSNVDLIKFFGEKNYEIIYKMTKPF